MSCERFRDAITAAACGDDAALDAHAARHLDECAACREQRAEVQRRLDEVETVLQRAMSISASPGFAARVAMEIEDTPPSAAVSIASSWWAAAAAALVLAIGLSIGWLRLQKEEPAPAAATIDRPAPSPAATRVVAAPRGDVPASRVARRQINRQRPRASAAPRAAEAPVIVPDSQERALARFRELLHDGTLNESTLPPAPPEGEPAMLEIAPLSVPEIAYAELSVPSATGAPASLK